MEIKKKQKPPIKILHVVYKLARGGLGTWLIHMLRHADREKYQMDFLVHSKSPGPYDEIARELGAKIIYCPFSPYVPLKYPQYLKEITNKYGPYDIIHSHLGNAGFHLFWASKVGIPVRIVHCHFNYLVEFNNCNLIRKTALKISQYLMLRYATAGIAVSKLAAPCFGPHRSSDSRWRILYCGIDLECFRNEVDRRRIRKELGIPEDAFVLGHVGRIDHNKNHTFIMEIMAKLAELKPEARLLLIGDGHLRPEIEQQADRLGLTEKVIFLGIRSDVPRLMKGGMDVFIFPSFYEGNPLVIMEAQAAGLPCVISDVIPEEADVVKPLVYRLSLTQPASMWAEAVLSATTKGLTTQQSLDIVEQSPYNIKNSIKALEQFYEDEISKAKQPSR